MDQFIQVKCRFQLTTESESSETIQTNSERIRLCTSVHLDNNSSLIVLVCSNDLANNHIVVYHIESRKLEPESQVERQNTIETIDSSTSTSFSSTFSGSENQDYLQDHLITRNNNNNNQPKNDSSKANNRQSHSSKTKPRIRVKQIYYHPYNEDIVAISLSHSGSKLAFISASSTIYILPIKNILLKLNVKQSRSSQGQSMYFYDASIIDCCTIENPNCILYWEPTYVIVPSSLDQSQSSASTNQRSSIATPNQSMCTSITRDTPRNGHSKGLAMIVVTNSFGDISIISVDERKQISLIKSNEKIISIGLIRDRFSVSILFNCQDFKQLRLPLELKRNKYQGDSPSSVNNNNYAQMRNNNSNVNLSNDDLVNIEQDLEPSVDRKPIQINLNGLGSVNSDRSPVKRRTSTPNALRRLLMPSPSANRILSAFSSHSKDLATSAIFYHSWSGLISVVDVIGPQRSQTSENQQRYKSPPTKITTHEYRLFRFFIAKQFYYKPQKPNMIFRLNSLSPHEKITQVVLTERFLVVATDHDRCLINSRNCCFLGKSNPIDLNPLIKEIKFTTDERILDVIRSPVSNDLDGIIDSFLLITDRSIYSIEARQSCRKMYVNLIDSHLGITRERKSKKSNVERCSGFHLNEFCIEETGSQGKDSETNLLLVNNFLAHRDDVYEKITFDSRVFSILFKIDLNSLYEAYADKLLLRKKFKLANRFFHMAKFDHMRTLGKYIRLGAYNETIDYVINLFNDDTEIITERERLDLSKVAFECLLAKTIVERSKLSLFKIRIRKRRLKKLFDNHKKLIDTYLDQLDKNTNEIYHQLGFSSDKNNENIHHKIDPFRICEHNPRCQEAKLSTNTIIIEPVDGEQDEDTMTDVPKKGRNLKNDYRLECGKALMRFVNSHLPQSLYSYALIELVDLGLMDLAEALSRTDVRIYTLVKIILRARDENRLVFRTQKYQTILQKLHSKNLNDLTKLESNGLRYLEFITAPEVTKALIKDFNLTIEYIGNHNYRLLSLGKYSTIALYHFESFKKLVILRSSTNEVNQPALLKMNGFLHDEDANQFQDLPMVKSETPTQYILNKQQKQTLEIMFLQFMKASLDESTDDSCRLWSNYINFYLNNVGPLDNLKHDILNLSDKASSDCRLYITLFKAIGKDEPVDVQVSQSALGSVTNSLARLFDNLFLMELLDKTLSLIPKSTNVDAISDCLGLDGFMGEVEIPVEDDWKQIFKTIQTAASGNLRKY